MKSARAIAAGSCSTTITVFPASRSRCSSPSKPVDVSRVQPDRRFVQHVECIDQVGAQRVGERDPLRFPAGERAGEPVQGQIAEADVPQVTDPSLQLVHNQVGDLALEIREGQVFEPRGELIDRLGGDAGDHRAIYLDAQAPVR